MFIFLLQLRHMLADNAEYYLFAVFSALVWLLWALKVVLSRQYRPFHADHVTSASVVIPVVDEPPALFREVLSRIVAQRPDEVVVVINGARSEVLETVCEAFAPTVRWVHTPVAGKRNALRIGIQESRSDITVLVDSDTLWTSSTLRELLKPFADERVGGVTTRQRILDPERSWITRWMDWLENTRSLYSMPAQSALGQVGCLPGRTIAFRRNILVRVMEPFLTDRFLGVFLEISDDRTLTNLTLKEGYRTVYQHTSLVYTDAPLKVGTLFRQQLRWARGSQYNTLRMLPWMLRRARLLTLFFLTDILLPFLLVGTIVGWVYRAASGTGINFYEAILASYGTQAGWAWVIGLMIASSVLSMAIRQIRHLQEKPSDFLRLPLFIIVSTLFLMPVRLIGFFRMGHVSGWGTRSGAYAGRSIDRVELRTSTALHDELDSLGQDAPVDVVDRGGRFDEGTGTGRAVPSAAGQALSTEPVATTVAQRTSSPAGRPAGRHRRRRPQARRRHPNPLAVVPYLLGLTFFALEALLYV